MNHLVLSWVVLLTTLLAGCGQKVGGYSQADVNDVNIVAAAKFAAAEQSKRSSTAVTLVKIQSAATQPVGLTNYKMELEVQHDGKQRTASVVVWETTELDEAGNSVYKLSQWSWD